MRSGCDPAIPARIGLGACRVWARTCSLLHKKRASRARRLSKVGQDELRLWVTSAGMVNHRARPMFPQLRKITLPGRNRCGVPERSSHRMAQADAIEPAENVRTKSAGGHSSAQARSGCAPSWSVEPHHCSSDSLHPIALQFSLRYVERGCFLCEPKFLLAFMTIVFVLIGRFGACAIWRHTSTRTCRDR